MDDVEDTDGISDDATAAVKHFQWLYSQVHRNELFDAIFHNSALGLKNVLSREAVDIDQKDESGFTPLLAAACSDASPEITEILLNQGASMAAASTDGCTPLHVAALMGKVALINLLVDRGAPLHAMDATGKTPLWTATAIGQAKAVEALAVKGANVDHRSRAGATPLHCAVQQNRLDVVRVLLQAKADMTIRFDDLTPLESALSLDHIGIARELMRSGNLDDHLGRMIFKGEEALQQAAFENVPYAIYRVHDGGARDTNGEALCIAIARKNEACVQALLECSDSEFCTQRYVNAARLDGLGWLAICLRKPRPSVRIVRLLVNAGADTTSTVRVQWGGGRPFDSNPTACVARALAADKTEAGVDEAHLFRLKGVLRLFQQIAAVHATSWVWPKAAAATEGKRSKKPAEIVRTLPVLRSRANRPRLLLASLTRYSCKSDVLFSGNDETGGKGSK